MFRSEAVIRKVVSASVFKATCLKLIEEMQHDGQPVTITRRGKVVAELTPKDVAAKVPLKSVFGSLKSDRYRFDDPFSPVADMDEWEANNPADLYK